MEGGCSNRRSRPGSALRAAENVAKVSGPRAKDVRIGNGFASSLDAAKNAISDKHREPLLALYGSLARGATLDVRARLLRRAEFITRERPLQSILCDRLRDKAFL